MPYWRFRATDKYEKIALSKDGKVLSKARACRSRPTHLTSLSQIAPCMYLRSQGTSISFLLLQSFGLISVGSLDERPCHDPTYSLLQIGGLVVSLLRIYLLYTRCQQHPHPLWSVPCLTCAHSSPRIPCALFIFTLLLELTTMTN
jgi:hypothetical protein